MRILFLDDDQIRHDTFLKLHKEGTIDQAYTAEEAIEFLSKNKYDQVHLDHDLSVADQMCDPMQSLNYNGTHVARYMVKDMPKENYPAEIIIHSFNPAGARLMKYILDSVFLNVKYIPFGT